MSEWFKEHAWKVCIGLKLIEGSNPSFSAIQMLFVPDEWHFSFSEVAKFYLSNQSESEK